MRLIALNGFMYPIDKWLHSQVETPYSWNWTQRKADQLSQTIAEPTIIVGFSDGATAALRITVNNPWIQEAYLHSPLVYHGNVWRVPPITFFRTQGDTTPTFDGTYENHLRIVSQLRTIQFQSFPHPNLRERYLAYKHHCFHNCLPFLPQEFVNV